jgi:light-regulated signal transduction histidine kinase (bacteriophytochrome)
VTPVTLALAIGLGVVGAAAVGAGVAAYVMRRWPLGAALRDGAAVRPAPAAPQLDAAASAAEHEAFGYIVSHDLRAPIRVVEGFTKIVKEDYGAVLDRVGHDHLDRVLGAAARMNSMIDALLALSRLSSQPVARVPVNLSQIAGFVIDDLRRQHPERAVEVEIEPALLTSGDPTLLRVMLENLLGNAWKYTSHAQPAKIGFVRRAGEATAFTVYDNGAGFDMRFADRLFGVFQRLHSASEFPGTGVGLASVRRIVRRHHGEIWAESEPERGARFHFSLPLEPVPAEPR